MMRRLLLGAAVTLLGVAPVRAQAWLPSQGEVTVSFVYSNSFVDAHDLSGTRDYRSDITTKTFLSDVTFGVKDNLSVTVSLPVVSSKFITQGTPAHPTIQDDGQFHTTATDLRVDVRYNVLNRRGLVITPFAGSVTPSHSYEYFAHAAPGRRVNELQVGTYVGTTLDDVLPGMFVQARYAYGFQEKFLDISHNRSMYSVESGYFATPDVRIFGMVSGQVTHGGVNLTATSRLVWPEAMWLNHDRIVRENFVNVGGGIGWAINDTLDVFGSFTKAVSAVNTHILDRGILIGASIRLQKSVLERGIINLSASNKGTKLARCACQKGLALKR
jgi:hypothetical protein